MMEYTPESGRCHSECTLWGKNTLTLSKLGQKYHHH
jgi:hypothetical protein